MGKYKLRYLPIAEQDLLEIVEYIQNNLQNPIAAENTLLKIENAIIERFRIPRIVCNLAIKEKTPLSLSKN